MKWFKHMTIARTDPKLCEFQDREGSLEAYGFYFKVVEIVGAEVDDSGRCSACYSLKNWSKLVCISATRWLRLSQVAAELQLWSCKQVGETWEVAIPNILKHRDNYTKDLQGTCKKKIDNLPLIRTDEIRTDKDHNTPIPPKGGDSNLKKPRKKRDSIPDEVVPLLNRLAVVKDGRKGPRFSPSKAWAIVQATRSAGVSDEDLERFWRSTCKQRATGDEPSFWPTFHVIAKVNDIKFWLSENPPGKEDHQSISRGHDPGSEKAQARIKELQELAKQNAEREKQQRAASPVQPVESIDFNNLFKP